MSWLSWLHVLACLCPIMNIPSSMLRPLRVFGLAVALCAGLTACGDKAPEELLASAKVYLAKNDLNAGIIELKNALQRQPNLAEARFLLGKALLDREDAVAAEVELRKASDLRYPDEQVLPLLAKALLLEGKEERLVRDYGAVRLATPTPMAELKTALATAYAAQGNIALSKTALAEALLGAPDLGPALVLQARLKAADRDYDGALALLDKVIAKDAGNYEALHVKGQLLRFAKADAAGALEAERRALTIRKDWLPAQASVLEILVSRHEPAAAKAQLAELKKAHPVHPQTRYLEAEIAFLDQDYKAARELIQQVLKVAPENVNALVLAGSIEMQVGSLAQAENLAAKAMKRSPQDAETRLLLARIYLRSGESSKAQETLTPLLEGPDVTAEALNLAGQAALQSGDAKSAEAQFSRAAKLNPGDVGNRTDMALIQVSKGNSQLGLAQLEEIASADKGTVADMAIISARLRQSDYDAALKAIDSLERKLPDKPLAAQFRGEVQLMRQDYAAARQSFTKALAIDPLYFPAAARLSTLDLRDKKPDEARKRFARLLAADPKNVRALVAVAELRAMSGARKEEVAGLLADAIRLNPSEVAPRLLLIELWMRNRNYKEALVSAQDAVAALPERYDLLDALGRAQAASGDFNQAIASFSKLVAAQPKSPRPLVALADVYVAAGDKGKALRSLEQALRAAPNFLPAQQKSIALHVTAGRRSEALAIAREVQKQRPTQAIGWIFEADIQTVAKNWTGASALYQTALQKEATTSTAEKLHASLLAGDKRADAEARATQWTQAHPGDATFILYLGGRALAEQRFAEADARFQQVVKLQPDNPIALNNLAWTSARLDKPGAVELAERANKLAPNQPQFMNTLAVILAMRKDWKRAIEIQQKAVTLQPQNNAFRLSLAKMYVSAGENSLARKELEQLARLGGRFPNQQEVAALRSQL